jgi:hypothetical protein
MTAIRPRASSLKDTENAAACVGATMTVRGVASVPEFEAAFEAIRKLSELALNATNYPHFFRRAAEYADRILKGANRRGNADRAAHQIRPRHQPQDRQGARRHRADEVIQ